MNGNFMICTKCSYFSQLFVALTSELKVLDTCQMCASYCQQSRTSEDALDHVIKSA